MSLSEKTLEIAITHEILTLHERIFYDHLWHFHWRRPRHFTKLQPYATGLTLAEEEIEGYDVKIEVPRGWQRNGTSYIYFLQFKKGNHRFYSSKTSSIFHGSISNKKKHLLFGLNNNSNKNQHINLRALQSSLSSNKAFVGYALPLVGNIKSYKRNIGQLMSRTLMYTAQEIDSKFLPNKIIKGIAHSLAISYKGDTIEIRSEPTKIKLNNEFPNLVNEIYAIQLTKLFSRNFQYPPVDRIVETDIPELLISIANQLSMSYSDFALSIETNTQIIKEYYLNLNISRIIEIAQSFIVKSEWEQDEESEHSRKCKQNLFKILLKTTLKATKIIDQYGYIRSVDDITKFRLLNPVEIKEGLISLKLPQTAIMKDLNMSYMLL